MSGTGYDLSASTYFQDGRIFQIEYAQKAVDAGETVIGLLCADGVILASEKLRQSPLEAKGANPRIFSVEAHIGLAIAGNLADGQHILHRARKEAASYRKNFGVDISGAILAERLANFVHAHTLYGAYRPFGCSILLSSVDNGKYKLFMIENSGSVRGYSGVSAGKGHQTAKTVLEKAGAGRSVANSLAVAAKAIALAHEEFKEKSYDLEISLVAKETEDKHVMLEFDRREDLKAQAEAAIEEEA